MGYFHCLQGLDAFIPLLLPHGTQMRAAKNIMNSVFIHPFYGKVEGIDDYSETLCSNRISPLLIPEPRV